MLAVTAERSSSMDVQLLSGEFGAARGDEDISEPELGSSSRATQPLFDAGGSTEKRGRS